MRTCIADARCCGATTLGDATTGLAWDSASKKWTVAELAGQQQMMMYLVYISLRAITPLCSNCSEDLDAGISSAQKCWG